MSDVIAKCWGQGYASADEILKDVKAEGNITVVNCLRCTALTLLVIAKSKISDASPIPATATFSTALPIAFAVLHFILPIVFLARRHE